MRLLIGLVALLFVFMPAPDPGPAFAFAASAGDGVDLTLWREFRTLRARLSAGETINERDWSAFLGRVNSPNVRPDRLRRWYELAFAPVLRAEAASLEGYGAFVVGYLREAAGREAEIDEFLKGLDGRQLRRSAVERAAGWLPGGAVTGFVPGIRILPFGPDGYAEADNVLIDPYLAFMLGRQTLTGFIAHEFHHIYARRLDRQPQLNQDDPDRDLLRALVQLQLEGIADLVDKKRYPIEPVIPLYARYAERFTPLIPALRRPSASSTGGCHHFLMRRARAPRKGARSVGCSFWAAIRTASTSHCHASRPLRFHKGLSRSRPQP